MPKNKGKGILVSMMWPSQADSSYVAGQVLGCKLLGSNSR